MKEKKKDDVVIMCLECSKKLYPNTGKFTKNQLAKAKFVKAMFSEDGKMPEHMWIKVKGTIKFEGSIDVCGKLNNTPTNLEKIHFGDKVIVSASKIEDVSYG